MTIQLSSLTIQTVQSRPPRYEITWLIRRLSRAMAQLADSLLRAHGLASADRAVLEFLSRDGALSVPQLAARYQVSRQHMQVTVNTLREDGFLESLPNPRHRRSPLFALTPVGHELVRKIRAAESDILDALFDGIAADDIECTRRTLESLVRRCV